jgi:hypothetical protein
MARDDFHYPVIPPLNSAQDRSSDLAAVARRAKAEAIPVHCVS